MIDTLILRIHGTQKYRRLIKGLDMHNNKGYQTEFAKVDGKDIDKLRNQGFAKPSELLTVLKLNRTGEFLIRSKFVKQLNASNHYTFAYHINFTGNYIEFNFSVPKYVYGSNVLMFVEHIGDKGFNLPDGSSLECNIGKAYDRLSKFLVQLFKLEFVDIKIDAKDVEIHRVDVCFNQMFRSKMDALKYLEYQKRKRKKYARDEEGVMKDYETSLMYVTKRYSAKIYHKGSEYAKNDLKEHQRINKERKRQYFKTGEYQAFADKMLRYELTIRNGMINYLHKEHVFRQKCPEWQIYFKQYQKVDALMQKNDRISKKVGTLPDEEKETYLLEYPYVKIEKEARKLHKSVSHIINKRTYFVMEIDEAIYNYNQGTVNYDSDRALFSKGLFKACMNKLVQFISEYQVKELPQEDIIAKLIDDYNYNRKIRLPKTEMVHFYKELVRIGSFKDVAKFNYMSRTSIYRYKQRFKKIGITENNLIPLTEDGIPRTEIDLREYHYEHEFNAHFLTKNSFLDIF